jgi:hypothetical protein
MHKTTIENTEDVIDSRDVVARIDELKDQLEAEHEAQETTLSFEYWLQDENNSQNPDDITEYRALLALADEAEDSPDWIHGETLIRRSYFVDYIAELINDCYEMPKEMNSGQWPYRHMTIDYEAAANEAEQDYISVDFDGVEYLIRCV